MANPKAIAGQGFHTHPNRINKNGRPKKVQSLLKEYFLEEHNLKLSRNQQNEILTALLMKTKEELIEIANNPNAPWWISIIVKKIQRDFNKGSMHVIEVLFDRVYGKPKEETQIISDNRIEVVFIEGKTIL